MLDPQDIAHGFDQALAAGRRHTDPFPVTVYHPFSEQLYSEIQRQLPEDRFYKPLKHRDALRPDGTSTRLMLSLHAEGIAGLPAEQREFWGEMNNALRAPAVREAFLKHQEPELKKRFGQEITEIPCFPAPRLLRDADGYKITPHPDDEWMVFTAQVYLPSDRTQTGIGTSMYRRLEDKSFELVHTVPFEPNTGYCFVRTDSSWHGVESCMLERPRETMMLTCFQRQTPF